MSEEKQNYLADELKWEEYFNLLYIEALEEFVKSKVPDKSESEKQKKEEEEKETPKEKCEEEHKNGLKREFKRLIKKKVDIEKVRFSNNNRK